MNTFTSAKGNKLVAMRPFAKFLSTLVIYCCMRVRTVIFVFYSSMSLFGYKSLTNITI